MLVDLLHSKNKRKNFKRVYKFRADMKNVLRANEKLVHQAKQTVILQAFHIYNSWQQNLTLDNRPAKHRVSGNKKYFPYRLIVF